MGKSFLRPTAARTSLGTHGRARTAQGQGGPTWGVGGWGGRAPRAQVGLGLLREVTRTGICWVESAEIALGTARAKSLFGVRQ